MAAGIGVHEIVGKEQKDGADELGVKKKGDGNVLPPVPDPADIRAIYGELCKSYIGIDGVRTTLLGLLPLASGGIFLFVKPESISVPNESLLPLGLFGFTITLGLLLFEVYGIRKCHALIQSGRELESLSKIKYGQFTSRPRAVAGFINEPFASGLIYAAVLAAWGFLALQTGWPAIAWRVAEAVFVAAFGSMLAYNIHLGRDEPHSEFRHPSQTQN